MVNYGTLAGASEYHRTSANGAAWLDPDVTNDEREAALIRASRSLDGQYGGRYPGRPTLGRGQLRAWPRMGASDHCTGEALPDDVVPVEIENATYALALLELLTPGASSPTFTPGAVNKREQVDVISRERFGPADGVALTLDNQRAQLAEVEDALRCILQPASCWQWTLRV